MKGFGFSEVDKREHDKRYFLGSYGTFAMDTIHGRLFELQVYLDSIKCHVELYFAFTLLSLMLWPTAAVLAIPLAYVAGNNRDLQMFTLILVMAFGVGIALWAFKDATHMLAASPIIIMNKQVCTQEFFQRWPS